MRHLLRILLLGLMLAGCDGAAPVAPSPPPAIRRVVVFGDSLAVSPSVEQSFPAQLQTRIDAQQLPWRVTNAGVSGDTTDTALPRLGALLQDDVRVLVVALGANDGLQGVPVAVVERNLSEIVGRAQRANVRVLLCGMETPPSHGIDYTIAFHYVFPRVAETHRVPLVPFLLAGVALNPDLNGPDGVHPNAEGARRIAETVWVYLEPLLRE